MGVAGPDNIRGPIPSWEVSCVRLGWGQYAELGVHVRQVWGSTCRWLGYLGMTRELLLNFPDGGRGWGVRGLGGSSRAPPGGPDPTAVPTMLT